MRRNKVYYLLLPFFLLAQFFSLFLLVVNLKPDIIFAHWIIPQGLFAVIIKKIYGIPVTITAHGTDVHGLRQSMLIWLKKITIKSADRIVTVSKSLAKQLVEQIKTSIEPEIISMGVDATLFSPQNKNRHIREQYDINGPFLLFVGRLTEVKGVYYLIEAMSLIVVEIPEAKLLIVGHGELEDELKKQVKKLDIQHAVYFVEGLPNRDLPQYYNSADIFISPSIQTADGSFEGFGITFVEAAMSGCLLIGTKIGGIEDIVCDGETGFLVPPGNSVALAHKIIWAIKNIHKIDFIRKRSRENCMEKFEWGVVSSKYKKIFTEIIRGC